MSAMEPVECRRLLIIGCGRSGTKWLTQILNTHGVQVGHEHMGPDGVVGWQWAAPCRWANHGWRLEWKFDHVWHVVRSPYPCISSMTSHDRTVLAWMERIVGLEPIGPKSVRCARLWVAWNRFCAGQAQWTFKIEDVAPGTADYRAICRALDVQELDCFPVVDSNHRDHNTVKSVDLRRVAPEWAKVVREDAAGYGYRRD